MFRQGKAEGWLHLDVDAIQVWASGSGVTFNTAVPAYLDGRGIVLVATETPQGDILSVDENLVLSLGAVKRHAQFDRDWREVLEHLDDFGQTPRGAILAFLLFQASMSIPDLQDRFGVHSAFTGYVKTLPSELLPTFWTAEELKLLLGTTLAPAVSAKLGSLRREYDLLCARIANSRWFKLVESHIDFDDWLQVDAMFRSRALDFYGSCMIPGIDLASHAGGERTNAFYDRREGTYSLGLLQGKHLKTGEEITITYGDEKGACEMLFSYGFIEDHMENAETLFLGLTIPEEDLTRFAKLNIAQCAPGFRIVDTASQAAEHSLAGSTNGSIDWTGDFVWLLCVNEDDGFRVEIATTVDGDEELQATCKSQELPNGAPDVRRMLAESDLWDLYQLRAVVILQRRVFDQLRVLYQSHDEVKATSHGSGTEVRDRPYELTMRLRKLEFDLLEKAYEEFERQKLELAESPVVKNYLEAVNGEPDVE